MTKTATQLDREIAESYLGMVVTADTPTIPPHRVTGVAREVTATLHGTVMLTLEKPDGSLHNVFLGGVVPQVPQARATYRGRPSHALTKEVLSPRKLSLGRNVITEEQARSMPRFEFVAHWLTVVTRKKENRDLAQGKRVRRVGGKWQIVYPNGLVEYETPSADLLFDYARRGTLGWHVRNAEHFRAEAYHRAEAR